MKVLFYRLRYELTDNKGNIVHTAPAARSGDIKKLQAHARVWSNGKQYGIYAVYENGAEQRI